MAGELFQRIPLVLLENGPKKIKKTKERTVMKIEWLKLSIIKVQNLMQAEEGQDLIEYALVVALIALS